MGGRVVQGDLDEPVPSELRGHVDLLLANAPYVPTGAIGSLPPEARDHEPIVALDGGADGLDVLRRVVDIAPGWLAPGGHVLFETSDAQSGTMAAAVVEAGLTARVVRDDETGATVVIGTAPHRPPARR
ncbi:MAG: hypothetical protein HGA44_09215 [Cellulomonadaceae bacterium]|nr:hypothetical protein [Cellulomonadaceae bacterium]